MSHDHQNYDRLSLGFHLIRMIDLSFFENNQSEFEIMESNNQYGLGCLIRIENAVNCQMRNLHLCHLNGDHDEPHFSMRFRW